MKLSIDGCIRRSVYVAFAAGLVGAALPVAAQEAPSVSSEKAVQLEKVQVTGSRVRSLTADSPSPIQVLTAKDIAQSGVTNVQELLTKIPAMGTPALSRTNSNELTNSVGVATIDLRNLGSDRTLVLVNGRRHVSGIPGSSAVDLNTIPTDFIERIEIFTGGASAIYGSDAMAGVVNIILKKNFQGVMVDAQTGSSTRGDDDKDKVSVTTGVSSEDGKSNIMAHFGYSNQGSVFGKDRTGNEVDNVSRAFSSPFDINDLFIFDSPFLSEFAPQGEIFFDTNGAAAGGAANRTFDRNGNVIASNPNGAGGATPTGFNRQDFRLLAVPTERYLFATSGHSQFAPKHRVFFEGTYAQTQTRSTTEPFALESNDIFPATGGVLPAEFMVNGMIRPNPVVPAELFNQFTDTDGDGLRDYSFTRRLSEVGNRGNTADRDTFRIILGVDGEVFKDWNYEVYAGYGATKESQVSSGQVNVLNFRNALEAIRDDDDLDGDGDTTDAVCRDANARAQGCVAANIFGFDALSPEAVRYITAPGLLATFTSQKLAGVNFSGTALQLPAGPLGVAFGFDYRDEFSRSEFDPLQQAGLNAGNAIPRTEGGFDVKEVFLEVKVPVLKDLPFAKSLDVSGAVRLGDYSTVGNVSSFTVGTEYAPVKDVRVRATRARSTRAPNVNELFSPPSQTFPQVSDPCVGVTAAQTGVLAERCRAAPGVNENIADNGSFSLNQADLQGTSGFDRGNPNAEEEVGNSTTVGIVWQPTGIQFLRRASFELDFYDIEITDALVSTPRQFILDQCYGGGDVSFCDFVTRRATPVGANSAGSLEFVDSDVSNSGGLNARGYDFTFNWADKLGPGRLSSKLTYSRLDKGEEIPLPGSAPDPFAGEVGSAKNKIAWNLGYNMGPWSFTTLVTYIDRSNIDDQFLASFDAAPGSVSIPSKTYLDFQAGYTWRKATFYFGMDNATDTKPTRFDTNALIPGASTGAGAAADVYDAIGQRVYAGVRVKL